MAEYLGWEQDWQDQKGGDIQYTIKKKVTDVEDKTNAGINSITLSRDPDKPQNIKLAYTTVGGGSGSTSVTTVSEATYTQEFRLLNNPQGILPVDTNASIDYVYRIQDKDGNFRSGFQGYVTISVNGQSYETRTYSSRSTSEDTRGGTFIINNSYLVPGNNTISIGCYTAPTETQRTVTDYITVNIYVLDLTLRCTSASNINTAVNFTDTQQIQFEITNSGSALSTYYNENSEEVEITPEILVYYGSKTVVLRTSTNTSASLEALVGVNASSARNNSEIPLVFQASYKVSNTLTITSNYCYVRYINNTGLGNTQTAVAAIINDIDYDESGNYIVPVDLYTVKTFDFYVYSSTTSEKTLQVQDNSETISSPIATTANQIIPFSYTYTFKNAGDVLISLGNMYFTCRVSSLNASLAEPTDYALYLTANGKTAGQPDAIWKNGDVSTVFSGFNWTGNGWVSTTEGTALLISNGAAINIGYNPFDSSAYSTTTYPFTISLTYKTENGTNSDEILISSQASNTGFNIFSNKVSFNVGGTLSLDISTKDVHQLTLVYFGNNSGIYSGLMAIYIDGVVLAIRAAGDFTSGKSTIIASATQASLYLYEIRGYRRALSFTEIQALYCFSKNDSEEIANYISNNRIFSQSTNALGDYGNYVTPDKLPNGSACLMLYSDSCNPTPWKEINAYVLDENESYKKARHFLKAIKLYIKGYEKHPRNFYAVNATISAQGTSSMSYPIKNFRIYFANGVTEGELRVPDGISDASKAKTKALYVGTADYPLSANISITNEDEIPDELVNNWVDPKEGYQLFSAEYGDTDYTYPSAPANRFCLKADYAESSGTHNTGFARMSNVLLRNTAAIQTITPASGIIRDDESSMLPQQRVQNDLGNNAEWKYDIRANVDGRPIYLFYVEPGKSPVYGGRYNMNNDKSNVLVFGFEKVTDYYNNANVKAEGTWLANAAAASDSLSNDQNYAITHNTYTAKDESTVINPTECWEFSSNDGDAATIGSFYKDPKDAFNTNATWLNTTWEYRYPDLEGEGNEKYVSGESKPFVLSKVYQFLYTNNYARTNSIANLNTFASQLHYYFNVNSVLKYFVLTHMFAAVDQRIKNCMLSFYCDPYITAEEAGNSPIHRMRGYWIFYDNDTILGLRNSGDIAVPWDFYETDDAVYAFPGNGQHGLWSNLQKCYELYQTNTNSESLAYKLGKLVATTYEILRNAATDAVIKKYIETEQCDYYPDAVHNVDLSIKYLHPGNLRNDDLGVSSLDKAQGTRSAHRKLWLDRRFTWLDDLYNTKSVSDYNLLLKVASTSSSSKSKGRIALTKDPFFKMWTFYGVKESKGTESTGVLKDTSTGYLYIDSDISNSKAYQINGLYGCKAIDFSEYDFADDISGSDVKIEGILPYLTDFTIRKIDDNPITLSNNSWINWFNSGQLPNLKKLYACNITVEGASGNQGIIDLSSYNLLEDVDLRNTNVGITLSNSSALTSLYIDNPSSITLTNKTNLIHIGYNGASVSTLNVSNCNSAVYTKVLTDINAYYNNMNSVNISFGISEKEPYQITNEQADLLVEVAAKVRNNNNFNFTGWIYSSDSTLPSRLDGAFPNLVISATLGEFSLISDKSSLEEGKQVIFTANYKVDQWKVEIDGSDSNSLNGYIQWTATDHHLYVTANPYSENAKIGGVDHVLKVTPIIDGEEQQSQSMSIYYLPVTRITLSKTETFFDTSTKVNIVVNENSKSHILTTNNIQATILEGSGTVTVDSPTQITYTSGNGSELDVTILVTFANVSSSIVLKKNSTLCSDFTTLNSPTNDRYWLYLLKSMYEQTSITITRKEMYSWKLTDGVLSMLVDKFPDEYETQDFTELQYCSAQNGGTFTIPNIKFSDLHTPEDTTILIWEPNRDIYMPAVKTITCGDKVNRGRCNLSFTNNFAPDLKFDLSKTSITKIGNFGSNYSEGQLSINITKVSSLSSSTNPLFNYPKTLAELGNFDDNNQAMFNLIDGITTTPVSTGAPIYSLMYLTSSDQLIKLGRIASYAVSGSAFDESDFTKISETAYTFENRSNTNGRDVTLNNVVVFGKNSAKSTLSIINANSSNTQLIFGDALVEIGESAFATTTLNIGSNVLNNLITIGDNAFTSPQTPMVINIGDKIDYIGTNAFYSTKDNESGSLTVSISKTSRISSLALNAFNGSTTTVKVTANSDLYAQLENLKSSHSLTFNLTTL